MWHRHEDVIRYFVKELQVDIAQLDEVIEG